jgi:hypothetical protein
MERPLSRRQPELPFTQNGFDVQAGESGYSRTCMRLLLTAVRRDHRRSATLHHGL